MNQNWFQLITNLLFLVGLFANTILSHRLNKKMGRVNNWIKGKNYKEVRIYVYDDDIQDLDLIERFVLSEIENESEKFSDQAAFLKKAEIGTNVFIIDHYGPGLTGIEIAKKIKKANPNNWAIAFSATQNIQILLDYTNEQDRVDKFVSKHGEDRYRKLKKAINEGIIIISNQ